MSKWTRRHTLIAGVVLILVTNAVALLGVAYNRGDTECILRLTQRELHLPYNWGFKMENSGIALQLQWRTLAEEEGENLHGERVGYSGFGREPDWLNKAKLAALGFDVSVPEDTAQGRRYYDKMLSKQVLLVLEHDGIAYRSVLARTQRHLQNEQVLFDANPGKKEFSERAKNAKQALYREERINSRLFVVDAGHDVANLRARYPNRDQYAIVRGQVQPRLIEVNRRAKLVAYIDSLAITQLNVPARHRRIFEPLQESARTYQYDAVTSPYTVSVVFGRRLEPWITEAQGPK